MIWRTIDFSITCSTEEVEIQALLCIFMLHVQNFRFYSGDDSEEETPVPIPNTAVKLFSADGTMLVTVWKSRTLPGFLSKRLA